MSVSTCCYVSCVLKLAGYSPLRGGSRRILGLGGAQGLFSFNRQNNSEVRFQWRKAYTSYSISSVYVASQRRAVSNGEMRPPFFAMKNESQKFSAARKRKVAAVSEVLVEDKQEESLEASVNLEEPEKPSKSRRTKHKDLLQDSSLVEEPVGICTKSKRSRKKHDMINPDEESLEASVNLEEPHEKSSTSRRTRRKVFLIDLGKELLQDSSLVEEPVEISTKSKRSRKKHDVINPDEESLEAPVNVEEPHEKSSKSRRTRSKVSLIDCGKELLQDTSLVDKPFEICTRSKRSRKKHDVINPDEKSLKASVSLGEHLEKSSKSRRTKNKKSLDISSLSVEPLQKPSKSRRTRIKVDLIEPNKDLLHDCSLLEKPVGKGTNSGKTRRKLDVADFHEELLEKSSKSRKITSKFNLTYPSKDLHPDSSLIEEPLEKALKSKKARKKLDVKDSKESLEASCALEKSFENQYKSKKPKSEVGRVDPNEGFYLLEFDGASKGNPGKAGSGAVLRDQAGSVICKVKEGLGIATNNVAEYRAVIRGLKVALSKGVQRVHVQGDSKLVCMQIQDSWKTKSENIAALNLEAKELLRKFEEVRINHIYREANAEADALANAAIKLKSGEWTSM